MPQQRHLHLFGQPLHAFAAKEVIAVFGKFGGGEPRHVFHQSQDGHVHLLIAVHVNALACIGQCHGLRGADDDGSRDGQVLEQREVDVGSAGRRVEDEVVQLAPVGVGNELLQRVRGHAAAPQGGCVGVDEEADGEYLHSVFIGRDEELPPVALFGEDAFRLQVEHFGNGRAEDVGIEQSDLVAELGQGYRQVGGHGALAHAAFAGTDGNDVLHLRQHFAGFGPGGLQGLGMDGHLYRLVHIGMDGGFGSLDHGFEERVG